AGFAGEGRASAETAVVVGADLVTLAQRVELWPPAFADDPDALNEEDGSAAPFDEVVDRGVREVEHGHGAQSATKRPRTARLLSPRAARRKVGSRALVEAPMGVPPSRRRRRGSAPGAWQRSAASSRRPRPAWG